MDDVKQPTRRKFLEIFTYIYGSIEDNYTMLEGKKAQEEQNTEVRTLASYLRNTKLDFHLFDESFFRLSKSSRT